ncbi:hypothetical protein HII31_11131 [Pseudocercospora fuligena]|uniref:Uncharacterized protein n=1 Tax=Pseudocercospora fuligena TaxID=685502 RepID=A0A8H6RBQ6_9PEZI|nr:hypothetical protein HII31_11131 [Pseudocercospora fuligena]
MQAVAALWLAPVIAMLYLNFSGYVIGQSAWCPHGNSCNNGTFNSDPGLSSENQLRYAKQDHNLLGTLQLVAKAVEIWFNVLALWLVYLITMDIAAKAPDLPGEYLTRAYRLAELWENIKPRMWTSLSAPKDGQSKRATIQARLVVFVVVTAIISILCASMGPAVAVLINAAMVASARVYRRAVC